MKCLVLDYGGSAIKYCVMDDQANMSNAGEVPSPLESLEQFVKRLAASMISSAMK